MKGIEQNIQSDSEGTHIKIEIQVIEFLKGIGEAAIDPQVIENKWNEACTAFEKATFDNPFFSPFNIPKEVTLPIDLPSLGGGNVPTPPDPLQTLKDIVQGINAAESELNKENFVIASGTVEAKLTLPVAGVTVTFNITPKPYS